MSKLPENTPNSYLVEIEIHGQKLKTCCVFTCDKVCGRTCAKERHHAGRCDCLKDCQNDVGPFDHLWPVGVPQPIDAHDTEEVISEFDRDATTKTGE